MGIGKKIFTCLAFLSAAHIGDGLEFNDMFINRMIYAKNDIHDNSYKTPFSIRKRYVLEDNKLRVQIGDASKGKWYYVMEGFDLAAYDYGFDRRKRTALKIFHPELRRIIEGR